VTPNFESKVAGKLKVCKRTVRILLQWSYTLSFSRLFVMNFGCKPRKECGNQGKIERLLSFACSKELGGWFALLLIWSKFMCSLPNWRCACFGFESGIETFLSCEPKGYCGRSLSSHFNGFSLWHLKVIEPKGSLVLQWKMPCAEQVHLADIVDWMNWRGRSEGLFSNLLDLGVLLWTKLLRWTSATADMMGFWERLRKRMIWIWISLRTNYIWVVRDLKNGYLEPWLEGVVWGVGDGIAGDEEAWRP